MPSSRAEYIAISAAYTNWQKYLRSRVNLTKDSAIPAVASPRIFFRERGRGLSPPWMWFCGRCQMTICPQIALTFSFNFVWDSQSLHGCFGLDNDCSWTSLLWMSVAQSKSLKGRNDPFPWGRGGGVTDVELQCINEFWITEPSPQRGASEVVVTP